MRGSSDLERVMLAEFDLFKKLEGILTSGLADTREISETLAGCGYDTAKTLDVILKKYGVFPESASDVASVKRTTTSTGGARISVDNRSVDQTEFRVSMPFVTEGESQDTPGIVPETPLDTQFAEQGDNDRVNGTNKPEDQSETQVPDSVLPEGGSQEARSFVPETPLDSQTLEGVERLDGAVKIEVESNDQSMARREDSSNLRLLESVGSAGESNTQEGVPGQEMVDFVGETPSESQNLELVAEGMKKDLDRVVETVKPEKLELKSNDDEPEGQVVVKEEKIEVSEKSGEGSVYPRKSDSVGIEMASEIKQEGQDVQMLDVVQETPSMSHDLKPNGNAVMEESVRKSEKVEKKREPEPWSHEPKKVKLESPPMYLTFEERRRRHEAQLEKEKKLVEAKKEVVVEGIEYGDFPAEPNWLMIADGIIMASSTTKRRRIENNEVIEFEFPSFRAPPIIRIRNHRLGEIGRLPMEWSRCLIPLVQSRMVKVRGKCINGPLNLEMMREISLYMGFYANKKLFLEGGGRNPMKLAGDVVGESNLNPLRSLFQLLNIRPVQDAGCTPDDLENRKRLRDPKLKDNEFPSLSMQQARLEEIASSLGKRRKVATQAIDLKHEKDEQAISESTLNKLVGAVEVYNLEEMEPPSTLTCVLKPYQKQALHWMSMLESVEDASKILHPCWAAYQFKNEQPIYVNVFSGEATSKMPSATESARGGILADAMGLGKTVMTIALVIARPGRGIPDEQKGVTTTGCSKVSGGTLIICPMALLGQWKDELETHSEQDSLSVFVHYGSERTDDPWVIAKHDVVLTTYGIISSGFKKDSKRTIYHSINWHRIVLDEAHTIKAWRTQTAQAVFALSSHCRWCLTGTPLQNNLEDLYSLLCFMKVEPWCNWSCWKEQIQKPYESGDPRGLTWVKAILKPLMLRRTKETKDREGRRILELPPTDVQTIVCDQTEAEKDFYLALFKRSKVQFDEFVAQGKVLNNYANILELLLRLRQCCNHPLLVMSRVNSEKYADLDKLARRFTKMQNSKSPAPPRAFVEEVVEGIRRGETTECPICLESPDDPVLTPCAHRMCRECLLKCWKTPYFGACPICRSEVKKEALITCPSEGHFRVDIQKNWKECAKVSKLMQCLEDIRNSECGGKSIIFSQWTSFLDFLEIPLKRSGFGFLRFDGQLSQRQRQSVLKEFSETQHKTVMLMSLKAGGVGLNLTAASNVFLMDPWWNPAVEEQAIMRIHRIGQKRTVVVRRFIVKDTVEERLQQVQARKQQMIAGALTDHEVRSARLEELKMLFR